MKLTIEIGPNEKATLVVEAQERQVETLVGKNGDTILDIVKFSFSEFSGEG